MAVHGPTWYSPFPGTRWVFSKHHLEPGPAFPWGSVIYQLCVTSIWTSTPTGPHGAPSAGPLGQPQPRAEWQCPEQLHGVWPRAVPNAISRLSMSLTWEAVALSVFRG